MDKKQTIDEIDQLFLWSFLFKKGVDSGLIDTDNEGFLFTQEEYDEHCAHFPMVLDLLSLIEHED